MAAVGAAVVLLLRRRDWWLAVVTTMLTLHAGDGVFMLVTQSGGTELVLWNRESELVRLAVSVLALAIVLVIDRAKPRCYPQAESTRAQNHRPQHFHPSTTEAGGGSWEWDLAVDQMFFTAGFERLLGYAEQELDKSPAELFTRVHPQDLTQLQRDIQSHLSGEGECFETEHRIRDRDGNYRWVVSRGVAQRDISGQALRVHGTLTETTYQKLTEEKLLRSAMHDALTGLPNRALFVDRLTRSLAQSQRNQEHLSAILFMDLDRFKVLNDSLGHASGDHLLLEVTRRLQAAVRPGDTVARFGGDEFVVLLDGVNDITEVTRVADRIQKKLQRPFQVDGTETFASASIGIALSGPPYETADELLRDADTAMHRAKTLGGRRHQVFNERMHTRVVAAMKLHNDLRRAIERRELRVYFQPIVSLDGGEISGLEALVRWKHPSRGIVVPSEFMDLAEETGLVVPIDQWVLTEACREASKWHNRLTCDHSPSVSVNVSAVHFQRPELAREVGEVLYDSGLDPALLHLEITETALMDHARAGLGALRELKQFGVRVHIDDFGTGYSSLSYLHRFDVDALKIDQSFVRNMASDQDSMKIVETIVTLALSLGMDVIAEGVENEVQASLLKELHCTHAQGFLFAKPINAAAVQAILTRSRHA
jgi:diguanylate cyclase (GGDEF)-like protein/PAS domain S-box-containing protein